MRTNKGTCRQTKPENSLTAKSNKSGLCAFCQWLTTVISITAVYDINVRRQGRMQYFFKRSPLLQKNINMKPSDIIRVQIIIASGLYCNYLL